MNRDLKMDKNTENFLKKLLDAREMRFDRQTELAKKYNKPIISFMLNIPGIEKRNQKYLEFHKNGIKIIKSTLSDKILEDSYYDEDTGMYYLASVDMDAIILKQKMIEIENSDIGRIYDIDVFDENMNQISRKGLDLEPRKCIICDNTARVCIKEKRHSYEKLIEKTYELINNTVF